MPEQRFIDNLFPIPLHGVVLNQEEMIPIQKEMESALDKVTWTRPDGWGQTHDLSTNNFYFDSIKEYKMDEFKKLIDRELRIYSEYLEFEYRDYKSFSWFSKFKPGDFGHQHIHGTADISGVYYYQTNGNDGDIYFSSPVSAGESSLCYRTFNQFWNHQPKVGKLLLFPGWLNHGIKRNESQDVRISFAFNIFFERFEWMHST